MHIKSNVCIYTYIYRLDIDDVAHRGRTYVYDIYAYRVYSIDNVHIKSNVCTLNIDDVEYRGRIYLY